MPTEASSHGTTTIEIDVRPDLAAGGEPFGRIMAAAAEVPEGGVLRLRAPFEPVPLYRVLGRQGFTHRTDRVSDDDWIVSFARPAVLDVRGLEPPEPMTRTLEALERLPPDGALLQINERVPRFLLPRLAERGFAADVTERPDGEVHVLIRRP